MRERHEESAPSNIETMLQKIMEDQANIMTEVRRTSVKCDKCVQKVKESNACFKSLES